MTASLAERLQAAKQDNTANATSGYMHINPSGLYPNPGYPAPCPSCGRCPTCGRGGWHHEPWVPYYPWITYCNATHSG